MMRDAIVGRRVEPQHQARHLATGDSDSDSETDAMGTKRSNRDVLTSSHVARVLVEMELMGVECSRGCCVNGGIKLGGRKREERNSKRRAGYVI